MIGLGRVGLPLALSFADRGLRVVGVDNDPARLGAVREGVMPFQETGAQELLERVHERRASWSSPSASPTPRGRATSCSRSARPRFSHIEIDMRDIRSALDDLLGVLAPGHSLMLRSTVAPGTTDFVAGYLAKHRGFALGEEVFVAHAPERIAAGRFLEEIDTLPCIIGGVGPARARSSRSCSGSSARRSCRPRPCRPSSRRSGPTSCATRCSRCRTC